ncbi:MAG: hypothetical protein ABIZ80_14605, partial [Bryobacteraceae bacterium]
MRRAFLLLALTVPLWSAVTNVRVTGTTPIAAILNYSAPDGSACSVEVSESATYSPVVKDVNTVLFPGSNLDSRAGNAASGRQRTFVVGAAGQGITYAPIASDGKRHSRALRAFTAHHFRITCGGDTATGTFQTANLAPGDL